MPASLQPILRQKQAWDGGSKMKPISGKQTFWIFSFLGVVLSTIAPASCRQWAHNPTDLASDYLTINDNRGSGEIVLIMWLAAPRFAKGPTQDMLNKYVVIGVAHARTAKDGTMSFDRTTTLDAANAEGNKLTLLDATTMPPTVVGAMATMQSVFNRALGQFGQGVQWFAFDGSAMQACTKGRLSIPFAGEKYTFDTPVPGCP
jgi:hypothetical protein